jgi:hypothetical protein
VKILGKPVADGKWKQKSEDMQRTKQFENSECAQKTETDGMKEGGGRNIRFSQAGQESIGRKSMIRNVLTGMKNQQSSGNKEE